MTGQGTGCHAAPLTRRVVVLTAALWSASALAQPKKPAPTVAPRMSAARTIMAGAPLSVFLTSPPAGARLAIARPDDPADRAIVVLQDTTTVPVLQTPGVAGAFELRLMVDRDGSPTIELRQPLSTTEPAATLAAPDRGRRGKPVPIRAIGPNGERDRVMIALPNAPADADGPHFFPAENAEATLEAPEQPGAYELRYVLDAPVSGLRVIARRPLIVE